MRLVGKTSGGNEGDAPTISCHPQRRAATSTLLVRTEGRWTGRDYANVEGMPPPSVAVGGWGHVGQLDNLFPDGNPTWDVRYYPYDACVRPR